MGESSRASHYDESVVDPVPGRVPLAPGSFRSERNAASIVVSLHPPDGSHDGGGGALPEPAAIHSAAFLASVLDASRDCITILTLDGGLVFMNSGGRLVMEVDDFEAVRGCFWPSFWGDEHKATALAALRRARTGLGSQFIGEAKTMTGTPRWWDVTVTPIPDDTGAPKHVLSISRDITAARELEMQRELLGEELVHRIKNMLAVVGAIANQTFRGGEHAARLNVFGARLAALAHAQGLLAGGALASASMAEVAARAVAPQAPAGRCAIAGPVHPVDEKRTLALSLAIHELATNAAKYGAWSNESGAVRIEWTVEAGTLLWTWTESGGPVVEAPTRTGFGSRIITRNLASVFHGHVDLRHLPTGVVLTLTAPA